MKAPTINLRDLVILIADPSSYVRFPLYDIDETAWLDVSEWAHVAAQGRDHYVRLVYEGRLSDTGHKASLVKVTERRIEQHATGPVAYLRQYFYIVVKEPERQYAADGSVPRGRGMPLRSITLTERQAGLLWNRIYTWRHRALDSDYPGPGP